MARALATQPEVLLLDEPFGALDAKVRKELRRWLRGLHDELGFTSVFVTHDQEEALELSDRVVVMSNGHIEQIDQPGALYASPNSRFVFDFLGNANVFEGKVENGKWHNGKANIVLPDAAKQKDGQLYIRSHEFFVSKEPTAHANLPLRVIAINPIGAEVRLELTQLIGKVTTSGKSTCLTKRSTKTALRKAKPYTLPRKQVTSSPTTHKNLSY